MLSMSKKTLFLLLLSVTTILLVIATPSRELTNTFTARNAPAVTTSIDEFKDFDRTRAGLIPIIINGQTIGWRISFNDSTVPSSIIDEINLTEQNVNQVTGKSRKIKLISLPATNNSWLSHRTNDFYLQNIKSNSADGIFIMGSDNSLPGAFEITYDNNGAGLGLNLSKGTAFDLRWYTDHVAAGRDSIVSLELTDSSGRSFNRVVRYLFNPNQSGGISVQRYENLLFQLSEYSAQQVNLSNISKIRLYLEGGIAQDPIIDYLRVNTNPYSLSGNVKIRGTSISVNGAEVTTTIGTNVLTKSTETGGNYLIPDISDGSYSMSISKPGYVLVGTNFTNPIVIAGQNRNNVNFEFDCAPGYTLQGNECLPGMSIDASDGTFLPHVLVTWVGAPNGSSCELSRKPSSGGQYTVIAIGITGTRHEDTSSVPGTKYLYQVKCGGLVSDENEGYRVPQNNSCPTGVDCLDSDLEPTACASANGFLNQINIASVLNRGNIDLNTTVEYRDLEGIVRGSTNTRLIPYQKMDFIINDLGLVKDTYGTVCVKTDARTNGAWGGGLSLYKADARKTQGTFGDAFDFVLYYPYRNPQVGTFTQPLNTNHFGVRKDGTVANWIRITDAQRGDGERLRGVLVYTDASGAIIFQDIVNIPDGGRFDYSGHEAIGTYKNLDNIGMVKFMPASKSDGSAAKYYMSTGRYFYDCIGASCTNFYTAFVLPKRPSTDVMTSGGVSTIEGETVVLELNNNTDNSSADVDLKSYAALGATSNMRKAIPANGTAHVTINKHNGVGLLDNNTVGGINVDAMTGSVATTSIFYKLDNKGVLEYAYAAPLAGANKTVQFSEFNSFIGNINVSELFNSTDREASVQIQARDASNNLVLNSTIIVRPFSTERVTLTLPKDTYGTIVAQSTTPGISFRNYVRRSDYVVSFKGE